MTKLNIQASAAHRDAPEFIAKVNLLLNSLLNEHQPKDVYMIRIDNWFGEKWVTFSGKVLGALEVWNQNLVIPPFHPNRVLEESNFQKSEDGTFHLRQIEQKKIHRLQASSDNLSRKISAVSKDGLFLWFSSQSKTNQRGSAMAYVVKNVEFREVYLELAAGKTWHISESIGLTRTLFDDVMKA